MNRRLLVFFALAALAVAGAKNYTVKLLDPAMLGGSQLKAGEYQLTIIGDKAQMRNGKIDAEAPVKVETAAAKFAATTMVLSEKNGKEYISEIRLGGTKTKLIFSD